MCIRDSRFTDDGKYYVSKNIELKYGVSTPVFLEYLLQGDVYKRQDQLSSGDAETLISSAIAGLNADDLESFQILKDGSATSIYGARAMACLLYTSRCV